MAVLQFLSPFLYIMVAASFYHLSLSSTTNEILALSSDVRKFEIFILPLILGSLILFTRKFGYYVVIVGSLYLVVRGVLVFIGSNETDPVFPLVISNGLCLVVVATLLSSTNRSIYFNPRLRWWETSPRYLVNFPASVTRVGAKPAKASIINLAVGGAGIETAESGFLSNEVVDLEFQNEGETFRLKSKIAWSNGGESGKHILGVQWADGNSNTDWSKIRRLVRKLKSNRTETTRNIPPRLSDVKAWFSKLAG
jgi:hypothetical protein